MHVQCRCIMHMLFTWLDDSSSQCAAWKVRPRRPMQGARAIAFLFVCAEHAEQDG